MPPIQSEADLDGELLRSDIPSSDSVPQQTENGNTKNEILSDRGNVTSREVLDQLDPAQISNEIRRKHVQANKTITTYDKDNASRAVREAFDNGRLLYIDKKNGQLFNSGVKGAYCPTAISEGVRKKNIQDFWVNVKWKKSGKQEMSFDGGQKDSVSLIGQ